VSHIDLIEIQITDLDALAKAAERAGCELRLGQKTYKWWGWSVGDHPVPEGFTQEDLGKCEHAIAVKGAGEETYEVGVVKRRDGKPGYTLIYDWFAGGNGLEQYVGHKAAKLKQAYAVEKAKAEARRNGFSVKETVTAKGIQLTLSR
jgi:hypothetical protein